nr:unnamed protein product [Spirometra erinaceieuropaei]
MRPDLGQYKGCPDKPHLSCFPSLAVIPVTYNFDALEDERMSRHWPGLCHKGRRIHPAQYLNCTLDLWAGHYANIINGTTGAFTPPDVEIGSSRFMYATSICRSFNFTARRKLYELGPTPETFHSAQDHPANADFGVNETLGPKNPPGGVFDLSNCLFKKKRRAPIFFSLPYFHKAAVEVQNKVKFVGEEQKDLEFTFNIEPKSGIILEGYKQFQLNLFAWGHRENRTMWRTGIHLKPFTSGCTNWPPFYGSSSSL